MTKKFELSASVDTLPVIAVIEITFAIAKRKPEKNIRLVREKNPWPPRYRFSTLTNTDDGTGQTLAKEKSFHTFHLQGTEDQQPCEQPCDFHMEHPGNVFYAAVVQS